MVTEIKGFVELYQSYTINDYDYWNYKDAPMFSLFVEKFEKKAQDLDGRSNQLILGIIDDDETGKSIFDSLIYLSHISEQ